MTGKTAVVFSCAHADPRSTNERADWLGQLIYDVRPDYVVDLGDTADMWSLSSHDTRYPEVMSMANYEKDIESYLDFQERMRYRIKKNKVKRPAYFGMEGNHENRIRKALAHDPRLGGGKYGISFDHLETDRTTTSTLRTRMERPVSLYTMACHTLTSLLLVTMVQLCLVTIMLLTSLKSGTVLPLLVIVISVICTLRMMHSLILLLVWSQGASKDARKVGLGKQTKSGGKAVSSSVTLKTVPTPHNS